MFIYIKMDAEYVQITPAIAFSRFHDDSEMVTKKRIKKWSRETEIVELEKKQGQIWNQRPFKHWRPPWQVLLRF